MAKRQTVWDIYNGAIAGFRNEGHTLRETGKQFGVTRERIRQILQEHYGGTMVPHLLPEMRAAQLIGCIRGTLKRLRERGIVNPRHSALRYWYSVDDLELAMLALSKNCKHCGGPILRKTLALKYCKKCGAEGARYFYPFMSEEAKKRCHERTTTWRKEHPERVRQISKEANKKYYEPKKLAILELQLQKTCKHCGVQSTLENLVKREYCLKCKVERKRNWYAFSSEGVRKKHRERGRENYHRKKRERKAEAAGNETGGG